MKIKYCFRCGCIPKPDEWYNDRLCIDCPHDEDEDDGEQMILESVWFYIIILALGFVWIYLTE